MSRLGFKAAAHLAGALEVLHADVEPASLFTRLAQAATRAVDCEVACFDGFDEHNRMGHLGAFPHNLFAPALFETLVESIPEHPLFSALIDRTQESPLKITDVCSTSRFLHTTLYNEYYRCHSITNQLVIGFEAPGHGFITCAANRSHRDFTEDDRMVFKLLKPHFMVAMRNARTVARLRQESAALHSAPRIGVARISAIGSLLSCDNTAEQLLRAHFGLSSFAARCLPKPLLRWLLQTGVGPFNPPADFTHHTELVKLSVRLVPVGPDERLLVLEERTASVTTSLQHLGLTRRELQVLQHLAQGLPDKTISQVCGISLRTVQNHLQNIYSKLGVDNRTAAVRYVLT
jgi:DNA-binding CsgD family transcriptional regulator